MRACYTVRGVDVGLRDAEVDILHTIRLYLSCGLGGLGDLVQTSEIWGSCKRIYRRVKEEY